MKRTTHDIEVGEFSKEFLDCHVDIFNKYNQLGQGYLQWIKFVSVPTPIHLSFRFGNQVFFVHFQDINNELDAPGHMEGFLEICEKYKCFACILQIRKSLKGWTIVNSGWGLVDARTNKALDPFSLVSDEKIEMSEYEIHEIGVSHVHENFLERTMGYKVTSWFKDLGVYPSITFINYHGEECHVFVGVSHSSEPSKKIDLYLDLMKAALSRRPESKIYFARVRVVNSNDDFKSPKMTLYRGHPTSCGMPSLQSIDYKSHLEMYDKVTNVTEDELSNNKAKLEEHKKKLFEIELIFAEQGWIPAMKTVAEFYSRGWHVTRNIGEANNWFYRAAISGDLESQMHMAMSYYHGINELEQSYEEAFKWFKSANRYHPENHDTLNRLAWCYWKGEGTKKDYKQSLKIYETLSKKENAEAMCMLGLLYYDGEGGIEQDYKKAVKFWKSAIKLNEKTSMHNLGECYYFGRGVEQDNINALKWFLISEEYGYKESIDTIYDKETIGLKEKVIKKMSSSEIKKAEDLAKAYENN